MFLDPLIFIFFTACVVSFLVGVNSASYFGISTNRETKEVIFSRIGIMYFIIPMVVATVLCSTYLALLGAQFNFVGLLVSQQGGHEYVIECTLLLLWRQSNVLVEGVNTCTVQRERRERRMRARCSLPA